MIMKMKTITYVLQPIRKFSSNFDINFDKNSKSIFAVFLQQLHIRFFDNKPHVTL